MDFDANISFLRTAFWEILTISGPILGVALVIGLLVGIFQAATSINEMTLAFVPKVVTVFIAFGLLAPYILTGLTDYFGLIFETIRSIS
jgi:flagellar biosynthetic protein FliQ